MNSEHTNLQTGDHPRVADVGCGTGQVTAHLHRTSQLR